MKSALDDVKYNTPTISSQTQAARNHPRIAWTSAAATLHGIARQQRSHDRPNIVLVAAHTGSGQAPRVGGARTSLRQRQQVRTQQSLAGQALTRPGWPGAAVAMLIFTIAAAVAETTPPTLQPIHTHNVRVVLADCNCNNTKWKRNRVNCKATVENTRWRVDGGEGVRNGSTVPATLNVRLHT